MLKLSKTDFDFNFHGFDNIDAYHSYKLLNIDVYNQIIINGIKYCAVYQTGQSFIMNDYNMPRNKLELSDCGGSHKFLIKLDRLCESDIFDIDEEDLIKFTELCEHVKTKENLLQIYHFLNDNLPKIEDYDHLAV